MKKVSTFFTLMTILCTSNVFSAYDHGYKAGMMITSCVKKEEVKSSSLEEQLKKKYPKSKEGQLSIYEAELQNYRSGLIDLFIKLTSRQDEDHQYKASEVFPNDDYKKCKDTICLADSIFGKGLGAYYLYILDEYNLNLSHLDNKKGYGEDGRDRHHQVVKYTEEELRSILIPLKMLPKSSLDRIKYNYPMKRIKRHKGNTIANATVHLFNLWGEIDNRDKIITIIHELGHVLSDVISEEGIDESKDWAKLSNWKWDREAFFAIYDAQRDYTYQNFVSGYARNNPVEDFAESFTAYIVNPSYLLEKAPKKYEFIKNRVFAGTEYSNLYCKIESDPFDYTSALNSLGPLERMQIANECEYSFTKTMKSLDMNEFNICVAKEIQKSEELPLSISPEYLELQFKNNLVVDDLKRRVISNLVMPIAEQPYENLSAMNLLTTMKPNYGKWGISSEVRELNSDLHRWMQRRLEFLKLEKSSENAQKVLKEILFQRAK